MISFKNFLIEKVKKSRTIKASGRESERHVKKYIEPFLPSGKLHAPETHEIGSGGSNLPLGTKVTLINHFKDDKGVNHVTVSDKDGNTQSIPVSKLLKNTEIKNPEQVEDDQINQIQNALEKHKQRTGQSSVTLHFKDGTSIQTSGIKKVEKPEYEKLGYTRKGKPKADAYFHDENGDPVHFISLKGTRHQQWGGITHMGNHPAVSKAVDAIKEYLQKIRETDPNFSKALRYDLHPEDEHEKDLMLKTMYGINQGSQPHGVSNVHRIMGGDFDFSHRKDGGLNFNSSHTYSNMNNDSSSDVYPSKILFRSASDRNDFGSGGRIIAAPENLRPSAERIRKSETATWNELHPKNESKLSKFKNFLKENDLPNDRTVAAGVGRFSLGVPSVEHHKLIQNLLNQPADEHRLYVLGPQTHEKTTEKDPFTADEKVDQLRQLYPAEQYPSLKIVSGNSPYTQTPAQALAHAYHENKNKAKNVHLRVVAGEGTAGVKGKAAGGSIDAYSQIVNDLNGTRFPERVNEKGEKVGGDYRMNYASYTPVGNPRGETSGSVVREAMKNADPNNPDHVESIRSMMMPGLSSQETSSLLSRYKQRLDDIQNRGETEKKLRQGVQHVRDVSYGRLGELLGNGNFGAKATEKTDGSVFQMRVRHDENENPIFGTRTSTSDWIESPNGYSEAARARFGDDFDPEISKHFDRIHNELNQNKGLMNYLTKHAKLMGGESRLRGEVFYKPHGRPAEDGGMRFIGTSYDPSKMGKTGMFVVHSALPENSQHDLEKVKKLGDSNFKMDDDTLPNSDVNMNVSDLKQGYDNINPELLTSRKKADAEAKALEKQKFESLRGEFENRLRNHSESLAPKWGAPGSSEKEGTIYHPNVGGPILKIQHQSFAQNKPTDLFGKK